MEKEFCILMLIFILFQISYQIGCMNINEFIKEQVAFTAPATYKREFTMEPTSAYRSITFYFKTNFDDTMDHMTIFSFKDQNHL